MKDLIQIVFKPKNVFQNIRKNEYNWGIILLVIILLTIINKILLLPISKQILENSRILMEMPIEQRSLFIATQQKMKYIGILISLVFLVLKMFFYTFIMWSGVSLFKSEEVSYKKLLSLFIISYFILLLGDLFNTGVIFCNNEKITSQFDVLNNGLNIFFDLSNIRGTLYTALSYINPFQIWFFILITIGLQIIENVSFLKACIISVVIWMIMIFIPTGMVYFNEIMSSKV